ncbi:MAG: hypothetical protein JXQ90_10965 [Cyclobacteriaceae bacterium]
MRLTITACLVLFVSFLFAQTTYKEAEKMIQKEKVIKEAKKEAKKWEKEGYTNLPGNMPLANQFERSLVMQVMVDDEGALRYLAATGSAIAGTEGVAQANAMDNTRQSLAGQIQSEVTALITSNKANSGYTATEMQTIDEFVASSKTLIQNKIGAIRPVIEMMRRVDDKFEYRYTVLYDVKNAKEITEESIRDGLRGKISDNEAELDRLLSKN